MGACDREALQAERHALATRVAELEIDLAHALNTIDELNTVVFDQGRQLDRLNRLVTKMSVYDCE